MRLNNPDIKIAKSEGVDRPILTCYMAGRISGDNIELCLDWRKKIVKHYQTHKGKGAYPISFLCPLNSGEASSVDAKGLTSSIQPNLIYDKDLLSVKTADVIIANMEDFFEKGIPLLSQDYYEESTKEEIADLYQNLYSKVMNRRENIGTVMEVAWGLLLQKPIILIVPESRKKTFELHPFTRRASVIVSSVDELLNGKYLELLYKSIASAIY